VIGVEVSPMPIKYALHILNPFNMNEFDDYEAEQPFQSFSVGDGIRRNGFMQGNPKTPPGNDVRVVSVRRSVGKVGDTIWDETWVITDKDWHEHHPIDED
jgi:hypothetical protein